MGLADGIADVISSQPGVFGVETDRGSWVVAAMAAEQTDFASRPDDVAPTVFGAVGEMLYNAWGQT
jgi:hypothetical protein